MNQLKYFMGLLFWLPFFPLMVFQGMRLRKTLNFPAEPKDIRGAYGRSQQKFHILLIGESSVAGVGASSHANGLPGGLARALADHYDWEVSWEVVARSGYTAARVNRKLLSRIESTRADLVVIGLGANDALGWRAPKKWAVDIEVLTSELRQRFAGTPIMFMHLPPLKFFPALPVLIRKSASYNLNLLGAEIENLVREKELLWFCGQAEEFNAALTEAGSKEELAGLFSDGIHPSEDTYQQWGHILGRYVRDNQLIKTSEAAY